MLLFFGVFFGLFLGGEVFKVLLFSMFISGFGKCGFGKVFVVESIVLDVGDSLKKIFVVIGEV